MFEEHKVIQMFKADVEEHLGIIADEIKKNNKKGAVLWLNELEVMRQAWLREFRKPGIVIEIDPWVNPKTVVDTNSTKHLAQRRLEILDWAIDKLKKWFQAKWWKL